MKTLNNLKNFIENCLNFYLNPGIHLLTLYSMHDQMFGNFPNVLNLFKILILKFRQGRKFFIEYKNVWVNPFVNKLNVV
jgi:hypothetical protein